LKNGTDIQAATPTARKIVENAPPARVGAPTDVSATCMARESGNRRLTASPYFQGIQEDTDHQENIGCGF